VKRLKVEDLKADMIVEELMCAGPIGSGKVTPMRWQRARVTAIVKRKSKAYPHGHVKIDVLHDGGGVECHNEIGLHEINKYLRQSEEPQIVKVDLLNASPHTFCETLRLAAAIGVTDAMVPNASDRRDHDLAALLCEAERYRYEHVRMLHEAYESGRMFVALRGQPTNMWWAEGKK